ncbi:MAG: ATP-binding protein [Patescibacteria group bacterium]|nr:ATP-binding protein [Patescibacteria group bacterium]
MPRTATPNLSAADDPSLANRERVRADFATVASHQLRTPISIMRWALDMVLSGRGGRISIKQREYLDRAYQQNLFMARLVGDLLRISRIDEEGVSVVSAPVNLTALVNTVMRDESLLARAYNCTLRVSAPRNFPTVVTDALKLKEVIGVLVDNGIRYGRREGHVLVALQRRRGAVVISVRDRGIGIPARQQHNIFTKFFRAENAIRSQTEGLGVQLYIAKHYVAALGGTIAFHSVYRKGTTFTVTLPLRSSGPNGGAVSVPSLSRVVSTELRRLSYHLSDGMAFLDPAFRILEINTSARKILGVNGDVTGRHIGDIVDTVELRRFFKRRTAGEESLVVPLRLSEDAQPTPFTFFLMPVRQQDVITAWMLMIKETFAHHRADVVAAERIRREREFVSITVHELNGPLSVNKWSIEMLHRETTGKLNAEQRRLVDQLQRNNDRQLVLVKDLLNLAKLQQGRFSILPQMTGITPILSDVIAGFRTKAKAKRLRILWSSRQKLPKVRVDVGRVSQVVSNLMSNAIKYTPTGGSVRIKTRRIPGPKLRKVARELGVTINHTDSPDGYLVISVQDSGMGIPPNQMRKLFTMFFRSQAVLKAKIEGTGLGLYIAKAIVELHQGDIWCTSTMGKGSTFSFSLPLA